MKLTNENVWDIYAPLYDAFTPSVQRELLAYVASKLRGDVLDLGTGTGKLFEHTVTNQEIRMILGVDSNETMLNIARTKIKDQGLRNYGVTSTALESLRGGFDTVSCINVLYAMDRPIEVLHMIYDRLKAGGHLVVSTLARSLDMKKLEAIADAEFAGVTDTAINYERYKACNFFLTATERKPFLFSMNEFVTLAIATGFKLREASHDHFAGSNITVILEK